MTTADLPVVNATLNAIAAVLLAVGLYLIKKRRNDAHKKVMLAAVVVSAVFLSCYLVYHANHGSRRFEGPDPIRTVYLAILIPHVILAIVNLPLIILTLVRALKGQFLAHRRVAKITWAMWMFVSVTGVVVYVMNYIVWPGRPLAVRVFDAGLAAHRGGDLEGTGGGEALALYRKAAGMGHVGASCFAAVVGDREEGTDTASAAIASALAAHPRDPGCLVLSGRRLVVADRAKEAVGKLELATQVAPDFAFGHATLGFAYFRTYEYKKAAAAFERSITLDGSMPADIYNAGYAHYLYGNYPRAREFLERSLTSGLSGELAERARRDLAVIDGALWVCPMHAHVTGKKGDTCGECKMALEPLSRGVPDE